MCQICNIEKGKTEHLMNNFDDFKVGDFVVEHGLSVEIGQDEDGYYHLKMGYFVDGESSCVITMDLDYCPFCGRELKHRNKLRFNT